MVEYRHMSKPIVPVPKTGLASLSPRSFALAKVVQRGLISQKRVITVQELEKRVLAEGFESILSHALLHRYDLGWQKIAEQLLRIAHYFRRERIPDFLLCWRETCLDDMEREECDRLLRDRAEICLMRVFPKSKTGIVSQIEIPDGRFWDLSDRYIAVASSEQIFLCCPKTYCILQSRILKEDRIQAMSLGKSHVYVGGEKGGVYGWNFVEAAPDIFYDTGVMVELASYEDRLAGVDWEGRLHLFWLSTQVNFGEVPSTLSFSNSGHMIAVGTEQGRVYIWDGELQVYACSDAPITALCFDATDCFLYLGDDHGRLFRFHQGQCQLLLESEISISSIIEEGGQIFYANRSSQMFGESKEEPLISYCELQSADIGAQGSYLWALSKHWLRKIKVGYIREESYSYSYLEGTQLWILREKLLCFCLQSGQALFEYPIPEEVLVAVSPHRVLDARGGIWVFEDDWKRIAVLSLSWISRAAFYCDRLYVLDKKDLLVFSKDGVEIDCFSQILYWSSCSAWWVDSNKRLYHCGEAFADLPLIPDVITGYRGVCCYRKGTQILCFDREGLLFETEHPGARQIQLSLDARFLAVVEVQNIVIYTIEDGRNPFLYPIQESVAELYFVLGWKLFVRYESGNFVVLQLEGIS